MQIYHMSIIISEDIYSLMQILTHLMAGMLNNTICVIIHLFPV